MSIIRPILRKTRDGFSKKILQTKIKTVYDVLSSDDGKHENAVEFLTKIVLRGAKLKSVKIANVPCFITQPNFKTKLYMQTTNHTDNIFLYVHGGGFVGGYAQQGAFLFKKLMLELGVKCIGIDYSLSPKCIFPTALNQIFDVYKELLKTHKAEKIFIGGESAGANLCLALMLKLKNENLDLPKCAILSSGFFDLTCSNKTYIENDATEVCLHPVQLSFMAHAYMQGKNLEDNSDANYSQDYASPILADLSGLPPIFVSVCRDEILYGDSVQLIENAQKYKVNVTSFTDINCFHAYMALGDFFSESKLVCDKLVTWLRKELNIKKQPIMIMA